MSEIKITVEDKRLRRQMKRLPGVLRGRNLDDAILAAAEPIRADAARDAPRSPHPTRNKLAEHIISIITDRGPGKVEVSVGPSRRAFQGFFQELGTEHHAAQPFLVPAFDTHKAEAVRNLRKALRSDILRLVGRT